MTGPVGFTTAEIRELVHEYQLLPHGTKSAWLARQPFSKSKFMRWRQMLFEGDLDRHLMPRQHGGMAARTPGGWSAFEKARAKEIAEHEAEVERLSRRIRELEDTNDALGKAIGLLHGLSEREPDEKPTTGPKDS